MRPETRIALNQYQQQIARLNGVSDVASKFAVTPSVQQTLETKIQESSAFLKKINIMPVDDLMGQKLGLSISGPITSNTDTTQKDRQTRDPSALDDNTYHCRKNNADSHITYAKLDSWSKFPDFQHRLRDAILMQQARDRMMIGFNGVRYEKNSDLATNPLLQDVNIGWVQQMRLHAAARVISTGKTDGKVVYGSGDSADYATIDALVYDMRNSLLDPWHRENSDLVAILGSDLMHDKYFPLVNKDQAPTETLASDVIISSKRVGGLQAVVVPFFPSNSVMVTTYDNLSIYFQSGGRRRHMEDNPKRDRIENYESSNDAYVIEDYGLACVAENIEAAQ